VFTPLHPSACPGALPLHADPADALGKKLHTNYNDVGCDGAHHVQEVLRHMVATEEGEFRLHTLQPADEAHRRLSVGAQFSPEQKRVLCGLRVPLYVNLGRLQVSARPLAPPGARRPAHFAFSLVEQLSLFVSCSFVCSSFGFRAISS